jgi:hypothetical protein
MDQTSPQTAKTAVYLSPQNALESGMSRLAGPTIKYYLYSHVDQPNFGVKRPVRSIYWR